MSACRECRCLACECCEGCAERDETIERDRQRIIALEASVHRLREVRDDLADALHELECGWWATGTVPEMMEAVRVIVRGTVDRATEGQA